MKRLCSGSYGERVRRFSSILFHSSRGYTNKQFSNPRVITNVSLTSGETYFRSFAGRFMRPLLSTAYVCEPLNEDIGSSQHSSESKFSITIIPHFSPQ